MSPLQNEHKNRRNTGLQAHMGTSRKTFPDGMSVPWPLGIDSQGSGDTRQRHTALNTTFLTFLWILVQFLAASIQGALLPSSFLATDIPALCYVPEHPMQISQRTLEIVTPKALKGHRLT